MLARYLYATVSIFWRKNYVGVIPKTVDIILHPLPPQNGYLPATATFLCPLTTCSWSLWRDLAVHVFLPPAGTVHMFFWHWLLHVHDISVSSSDYWLFCCSFSCYFQYEPDLVLVSAGFDSARGDPKVQSSSNQYTLIIALALHCQRTFCYRNGWVLCSGLEV